MLTRSVQPAGNLKARDVSHVWNVEGYAHDPTEWRNNLITHCVGTRFL